MRYEDMHSLYNTRNKCRTCVLRKKCKIAVFLLFGNMFKQRLTEYENAQ